MTGWTNIPCAEKDWMLPHTHKKEEFSGQSGHAIYRHIPKTYKSWSIQASNLLRIHWMGLVHINGSCRQEEVAIPLKCAFPLVMGPIARSVIHLPPRCQTHIKGFCAHAQTQLIRSRIYSRLFDLLKPLFHVSVWSTSIYYADHRYLYRDVVASSVNQLFLNKLTLWNKQCFFSPFWTWLTANDGWPSTAPSALDSSYTVVYPEPSLLVCHINHSLVVNSSRLLEKRKGLFCRTRPEGSKVKS